MIKLIMILLGVCLVIGTGGAFIKSISETPENLRGFYGFFYTIISIFGVIGGIALIVFGLMA